MVPADSRRIPRVPRYSGYRYASADFGYGPLTLYRGAFQRLPLACATCNVPVLQPPGRVATPWVWALPRSLATTGGIINLFSLPAGTKMFQFPALASLALAGMPAIRQAGCPIRKSADQRLFAPTRGLSQLITSFIASVSLGIHHAPLYTSLRRPLSASEKRLAAQRYILSAALFMLQSCLSQYFKDLTLRWWRITDSNR